MASKKNLKKDIDYLVTDLIFDCYSYMEANPEKSFSECEEIINGIILVKEDLLERINRFDKGVHGSSIQYFRTIKKDLVKHVTESYEKLASFA